MPWFKDCHTWIIAGITHAATPRPNFERRNQHESIKSKAPLCSMAKADAKLTPKNPYLCIKQNTRATQTREKSSVSFLNFSGSALKCPIYKGFRTCHQQTEIFIYDNEYRKFSLIEEIHQACFLHFSYRWRCYHSGSIVTYYHKIILVLSRGTQISLASVYRRQHGRWRAYFPSFVVTFTPRTSLYASLKCLEWGEICLFTTLRPHP